MPTYIPKVCPADEIWMVDLTLRIDMLPGPDHHGLSGRHIDERWLARIGVWDP